MRMHGFRNVGLVLAAATLLSTPTTSPAQMHARDPVATTPHFAFYSDFATNLNDALIAA